MVKKKNGYLRLAIMLILLVTAIGSMYVLNERYQVIGKNQPKSDFEKGPYSKAFMPTAHQGTIIEHPYFAISYVEEHEQSEWVFYELDIQRLKGKVDRNFNFRSDPAIQTGSAYHYDYRGSGYDRGHLVPAADMAASPTAVMTTFMMSNISPQARMFNRGIWRELEEQVRDWTRKSQHLFIATGPVLDDNLNEVIGQKSQVTVPKMFYKVLLDYTTPEKKAIGFLLPNEKSDEPISNFATTVDEVELVTGIDFFPNLPDSEEKRLESKYKMALWPINDFWTNLRIKEWNSY
ncbi:MAG: DNA/RNA non-specific endonuclease [Bacteroidota bacterium]